MALYRQPQKAHRISIIYIFIYIVAQSFPVEKVDVDLGDCKFPDHGFLGPCDHLEVIVLAFHSANTALGTHEQRTFSTQSASISDIYQFWYATALFRPVKVH